MKLNKNNARRDFNSTILNSWTWARLDDGERNRAMDAIELAVISGTYDQRIATLASVYRAFLLGVGYDGFNWREPAGSDAPRF